MRAALSAGVTLLLLAGAPRIEADEPGARELFTRGNQALAAGRRHEALALFLRSLELAPRPSTLLNIGQCYRLLDFPELALAYYRRYLDSSRDPSTPLPYGAEVREHIARLQGPAEMLARGREDQRAGAHAAALDQLGRARRLTRWPGLGLLLARSHLVRDNEARALALARSALSAYTFHLQQWRAAGAGPAPAHVQQAADDARELVRQLEQRTAEPTPEPRPGPGPRPAPRATPPPRSKGWLITSVVTGLLAVGAEIVAIVYYQKADKLYTDDPDFDRYRSVVIAGHISAGVLGALCGTSLVLHLTLAPPEPAQRPGRGALLTATFRF